MWGAHFERLMCSGDQVLDPDDWDVELRAVLRELVVQRDQRIDPFWDVRNFTISGSDIFTLESSWPSISLWTVSQSTPFSLELPREAAQVCVGHVAHLSSTIRTVAMRKNLALLRLLRRELARPIERPRHPGPDLRGVPRPRPRDHHVLLHLPALHGLEGRRALRP